MLDNTVHSSESEVAETSFVASNQSQIEHSRRRRNKQKKRNLSSNVPNGRDFVLDGWKANFDKEEYNGLKDKHLLGHFYNKKLRKLLRHNGLISKEDQVVEGKTCIKDVELLKHNHPDQHVDYAPVKTGTMILSIKLPKIIPLHPPENKSGMGSRSASITMQTNQQGSNQTSNVVISITPPTTMEDKVETNPTPSYVKSSRGESVSNFVSPSDNKPEMSSKEKNYVSLNKLLEHNNNRKGHSKINQSPARAIRNLQPMSKEDLQAAIERYKERLNQTAIVVDETPELIQKSSNESSRHLRSNIRKDVRVNMNYSFDTRNKSQINIERDLRDLSQEAEKKSLNKPDFAQKKFLISKPERLTPSPLPRETTLSKSTTQQNQQNQKTQQIPINLKPKSSRLLEPLIGYQETNKTLEKYISSRLRSVTDITKTEAKKDFAGKKTLSPLNLKATDDNNNNPVQRGRNILPQISKQDKGVKINEWSQQEVKVETIKKDGNKGEKDTVNNNSPPQKILQELAVKTTVKEEVKREIVKKDEKTVKDLEKKTLETKQVDLAKNKAEGINENKAEKTNIESHHEQKKPQESTIKAQIKEEGNNKTIDKQEQNIKDGEKKILEIKDTGVVKNGTEQKEKQGTEKDNNSQAEKISMDQKVKENEKVVKHEEAKQLEKRIPETKAADQVKNDDKSQVDKVQLEHSSQPVKVSQEEKVENEQKEKGNHKDATKQEEKPIKHPEKKSLETKQSGVIVNEIENKEKNEKNNLSIFPQVNKVLSDLNAKADTKEEVKNKEMAKHEGNIKDTEKKTSEIKQIDPVNNQTEPKDKNKSENNNLDHHSLPQKILSEETAKTVVKVVNEKDIIKVEGEPLKDSEKKSIEAKRVDSKILETEVKKDNKMDGLQKQGTSEVVKVPNEEKKIETKTTNLENSVLLQKGETQADIKVKGELGSEKKEPSDSKEKKEIKPTIKQNSHEHLPLNLSNSPALQNNKVLINMSGLEVSFGQLELNSKEIKNVAIDTPEKISKDFKNTHID